MAFGTRVNCWEGEATLSTSSLYMAISALDQLVKWVEAYSISDFTLVVLRPLLLTTLFTSPSSLVMPPALELRALNGVRRVPK